GGVRGRADGTAPRRKRSHLKPSPPWGQGRETAARRPPRPAPLIRRPVRRRSPVQGRGRSVDRAGAPDRGGTSPSTIPGTAGGLLVEAPSAGPVGEGRSGRRCPAR